LDAVATVYGAHKGFQITQKDLDDASWDKSVRSGPNCDNCVEVAFIPDAGSAGTAVVLRDSKKTSGDPLIFDVKEWAAFTGGIRDGEFDL
jgi:hypothetical protein